MAQILLQAIPPIPPREDGLSWDPNILVACERVISVYSRARNMLEQADLDPLRIKVHIDTLVDDVQPIISALDQVSTEAGIPYDWLLACAEAVAMLGQRLGQAFENAQGR